MIATRIGDTQRRILEHLKRKGSGTIPDLAEWMGMSVETIRTHLKSLGNEGLVERRGQRNRGPGRPEIVHGLTAAADALFPSREAELLKGLTSYLEAEGHRDLVQGFFERQVEERRETVMKRLEGFEGADRLEEVARILTDEGFMAEILTADDGEARLRLCHCPIRKLVDVTKAPCRAELRFVREMLGARLTRISYIPSGRRRLLLRGEGRGLRGVHRRPVGA